MIFETAQIILGLLFFLFMPGFLVVKIFFDNDKFLEKIMLSMLFSIMIGLVIGVFFGYDSAQAAFTGGFTETNLWLGEIITVIVLGIALLVKRLVFKEPVKSITKGNSKNKAKTSKNSGKNNKSDTKMKFNIAQKFENFRKNKGLYQLIVRSTIFFLVVFGIYMAIFLWIRHLPFFVQHLQIGEDFYFPFLTGLRKTDFLNAGVFSIIAFVIWNRKGLAKVKATKRIILQTIVFLIIGILFLALHYYLKYWIGINPDIAASALMFFTIMKLLLVVLFVVFIAVAIFTQEFLVNIFKEYWKSILVFLAIGIAYFFLIQFFQLIWYKLSYFVSISIRSLLELTFNTVYFSPGSAINGTRLGVEGFNVGISNECSGVDSLLLFLSLYVLLLVLDWKRMNIKRMLILLIPGLIGTVAYNILRIYLLMLVGIFINPEFAVDVFHTNIGWILFLLFFIVFWHFGSKWVYIKKGQKEEK